MLKYTDEACSCGQDLTKVVPILATQGVGIPADVPLYGYCPNCNAILALVDTETVEPKVEVPVKHPKIIGIPKAVLRAKSLELGVPVSDLTPEQIEEVRASLPKSKPVKEVSTSLPKSKPKPKPKKK